MNIYQLACQSIHQANQAGRLPALQAKVKAITGLNSLNSLADHPSQFTKVWSAMQMRYPVIPAALVKGAPDFRRGDV